MEPWGVLCKLPPPVFRALLSEIAEKGFAPMTESCTPLVSSFSWAINI